MSSFSQLTRTNKKHNKGRGKYWEHESRGANQSAREMVKTKFFEDGDRRVEIQMELK